MPTSPILLNKHYDEPSVFNPENLLREARRQKLLARGLAEARQKPVVCLAHVTNRMARIEGDFFFEKGIADGSQDAVRVIAVIAHTWMSHRPAAL